MTTSDFLAANWAAAVTLETRWETDVSVSAVTDAECRRQILNRPQRLIEFTIQPLGDEQKVTRTLFSLVRWASQNYVVPIYSDVTRATVASSGTTITVPTSDRRFYAPFQIVILPWNEGTYSQPQLRTLSSVTSSTLVVTASASVPIGSLIFPALEAHQVLGGQYNPINYFSGALSGGALERLGETTSLPASAGAGTTAGYSTYLGWPILDTVPNWLASQPLSFTRTGQTQKLGRDQILTISQAKGRWGAALTWTFYQRSDFWKLLNMFDSRRGRLLPFWVPLPIPFFEPTAISTTFVDVEPAFADEDVTGSITHLCIVMRDGTIYIRELDAIATPGDKRLSWLTVIPTVSLADILYVGVAILCRFESDALKEVWSNDEAVTATAAVIEVVDEIDHAVTGIDPPDLVESSWCTYTIPTVVYLGEHYPYDPTGAADWTGVDPQPNLFIGAKHLPFCAYDHWHGVGGGNIESLEGSSTPDPAFGNCGFGHKLDDTLADALFTDLGNPGPRASSLAEVEVILNGADWKRWKAAAAGSKPAII